MHPTMQPVQALPAALPVPYGARGVPLDNPKVHHVPAWSGYSDPQRLAFLRTIVVHAGRDPRIATLAVQILREAGVEPRNYAAQSAALLKWVQQRIYYVNEPGERLQDPLYTLKVGYGDCFPAETLLLAEGHNLVAIKDVKPGMRIWGRDKWSVVEAVADKGTLAVTHIRLTNGSTLRLTENHKVYVEKCHLHGVGCTLRAGNCRSVGQERIRVSELQEGMVLITPDRIPFGTEEMDTGRAHVEGLYLSDGSIPHKYDRKDGTTAAYDFSIAGRDGKPKEAQKHEVAAICDRLGLTYRVTPKEIVVHGAEWGGRMLAMGRSAPTKQALSINLREDAAYELLRGIMADSGKNTNGGVTFTTTSRRLATQVRLLWKMQGRTCGYRYVENHGGLGTHPIHRLNPRQTPEDGAERSEKRLRVKSITREVEQVPCFDIQTDDHYVYVPEADVTVSNCDDMAILLSSFFETLAMPWRFVISGIAPGGKKVRFVEGEGKPTPKAQWSHIYVRVGWPPFQPRKWAYAEPTLRSAMLGWDVVAAGGNPLPEMRAYAGAGETVQAGAAAAGASMVDSEREGGFLMDVLRATATGVAVTVFSSIILQRFFPNLGRNNPRTRKNARRRPGFRTPHVITFY